MTLLQILQPQSPSITGARFIHGRAGVRGKHGNLDKEEPTRVNRYVRNMAERTEARLARRKRILDKIRTFNGAVSEEELRPYLDIAYGTLKSDLRDMVANHSVQWQWMRPAGGGNRFRGYWVK